MEGSRRGTRGAGGEVPALGGGRRCGGRSSWRRRAGARLQQPRLRAPPSPSRRRRAGARLLQPRLRAPPTPSPTWRGSTTTGDVPDEADDTDGDAADEFSGGGPQSFSLRWVPAAVLWGPPPSLWDPLLQCSWTPPYLSSVGATNATCNTNDYSLQLLGVGPSTWPHFWY
ncbi:unnamed protein product [Miscanthus lutarioriparius]|uniref:Uncharacterized protein n=1 Tax=Miscanthus lutarioriparius TaxID=422564 RepID=A0A811MJI4_9POAL|nr:unnamed protein product [Miscanthus lutarioriparius]